MSNQSEISGEALGEKLLKSVQEMQAGKKARISLVAPNEVAVARRMGRAKRNPSK